MEHDPATRAVTAATNGPEGNPISAADLHRRLSAPNDLLLLDVRDEAAFKTWRIEGRFTPPTLNVAYWEFFEDEGQNLDRVPTGREVVVVCAEGAASDLVAAMLEEEGRSARNLAGGMEAWGRLHVFRPVAKTADYEIVQVDRVARGCLSYILLSGGQALVVDPTRYIDEYRAYLDAREVRLALVIDTHAHADHISGGPGLAACAGVPYYLHPYDAIHPFDLLPARLSYHPLAEDQTFRLGALTLTAIHVPGHTLGQINLLVQDAAPAWFCLTGDNLFLRSFGRPDLGGQGEGWAPLVYDSIFDTLRRRVPDDAWILPGHYAQAGEADADGLFRARMADLWHRNPDLRHSNKAEFISHVLTHLPDMPEQYLEIKRVNIGLATPDEKQASELELGPNVCALSTAYSPD